MKKFKKIIAVAALLAMMTTSARSLNAQTQCSDQSGQEEFCFGAGGYGYEEARRVPSLAPAIALGTVALVAVIALALNNSGHGHSSHSHN
jgi:hypothetical protein